MYVHVLVLVHIKVIIFQTENNSVTNWNSLPFFFRIFFAVLAHTAFFDVKLLENGVKMSMHIETPRHVHQNSVYACNIVQIYKNKDNLYIIEKHAHSASTSTWFQQYILTHYGSKAGSVLIIRSHDALDKTERAHAVCLSTAKAWRCKALDYFGSIHVFFSLRCNFHCWFLPQ